MEGLILLKPSNEHEHQAKEFIQEFIDNNSEINGTGSLDSYTDKYDEWLVIIEDYSKGLNLKDGYTPASTYFVVRKNDKRIVGMINIRHQLNEYLLKIGGHIGYGVRPTERKKGYATEILYLGLEKCNELGIDKVLLTCDKDNIGSAKTIQNNYGLLENEIDNDGTIVQRYWIDVEDVLNKRKGRTL